MSRSLRAKILKAVVNQAHCINMDVTVLESIESTNTWSLQQCKLGKTMPFACFAENQTLGKGRRGKQWLMSAHSNIAMSVGWSFDFSQKPLHFLPLAIALAVVRTLEKFNLEDVQIKWPNDVYVKGKKISGILIETQPIKSKLVKYKTSGVDHAKKNMLAVVVGVGLNYDISSLEAMIEDSAIGVFSEMTDVVQEGVKHDSVDINRELVASVLLQNVVGACKDFHLKLNENLKEFRTRYDFCKNKMVEITLDNQEVLFGIAQEVNEQAELVVVIDGKSRAFNSAEVSIKASP